MVKNLVKLVLAVQRLAPLSLVNFAEILECFKERNCHSMLVEIVSRLVEIEVYRRSSVNPR